MHGEPALRPGRKEEQTTINKPRRQRDDEEAPADDQRSREDLRRDVQQLRMETAYLKKAQVLVRAKRRSVPVKGR